MKQFNFFTLLLTLMALGLEAQPDPQELYPFRIAALNDEIAADPSNHLLIWERLQLQVSLLDHLGGLDQVYQYDASQPIPEQPYANLDEDFARLYKEVIAPGDFSKIEEGDFYLNRIWYHFNRREFQKAQDDAGHLRDSASYSRYGGRGDYYYNWALFSLYCLHVIDNDFPQALKVIQAMQAKKPEENPSIYYAGLGTTLLLGPLETLRLYEHFGVEEAILPFLEETLKAHFNWWKNDQRSSTFQRRQTKEQIWYFLKISLDEMLATLDSNLLAYQEVFNQLTKRAGERIYFDQNISDEEFSRLLSQLLEQD